MNLMVENTLDRQKQEWWGSVVLVMFLCSLSSTSPAVSQPLFFFPAMDSIIEAKCLLQGVPPEKLAGNKNAQNLVGSSS